jgi:hypothetical protein
MSAIPQTVTTMEAGFTVNQADAEEFWRHQERMGPVAAAAPGFLAVIGGPIARSPWLYFCGKWQTPDLMDQWYRDGKHKPMMKAAHDRWFGACYIRKWRLPEDGEEIAGPVFCETAIAGGVAASAATIDSLLDRIDQALPPYDPLPFETLAGQYERQPYQFVGPLQEFPQAAPVPLFVAHALEVSGSGRPLACLRRGDGACAARHGVVGAHGPCSSRAGRARRPQRRWIAARIRPVGGGVSFMMRRHSGAPR